LTAVLDQPLHAPTRKRFLALEDPAARTPSDKWVSVDYAERCGVTDRLRADGYLLCWVDANHENERIDLDGWEYVEVEEKDGAVARLEIRDLAVIGGYLVLLKKRPDR
jgi:hypothetical protein